MNRHTITQETDRWEIQPIPAFRDNYIWQIRRGQQAVLVDPGEAAPAAAALAAQQLELAAILITHHHADHIGGVAQLLAGQRAATATAPRCPVYGPHGLANITDPLGDGDVCPVLGLRFAVLAVPGHTLDHLAYFHAGDMDERKTGEDTMDGRKEGAEQAGEGHSAPVLFCGDTLFGCGAGAVFEGTYPQMQASLARLAGLPGATRVYCAHEYTLAGERFAALLEPDNPALRTRTERDTALRAAGQPTVPSRLAEEWETNPFLRWDAPAIRQAAQFFLAGNTPANARSAAEVFEGINRLEQALGHDEAAVMRRLRTGRSAVAE